MGSGPQDRDSGTPGGSYRGTSQVSEVLRSLHMGLVGQKLGFGLVVMGMGEILSFSSLKLYRNFLHP